VAVGLGPALALLVLLVEEAAVVVKPGEGKIVDNYAVVLADPEGNEFGINYRRRPGAGYLS